MAEDHNQQQQDTSSASIEKDLATGSYQQKTGYSSTGFSKHLIMQREHSANDLQFQPPHHMQNSGLNKFGYQPSDQFKYIKTAIDLSSNVHKDFEGSHYRGPFHFHFNQDYEHQSSTVGELMLHFDKNSQNSHLSNDLIESDAEQQAEDSKNQLVQPLATKKENIDTNISAAHELDNTTSHHMNQTMLKICIVILVLAIATIILCVQFLD